MTQLTSPKNVDWVQRPIIKMHDNPPEASQWEYKIWLPDWLAEWDVYGDWEVERFDSMRDNLKKGDVLFDIGSELGWQSIIYASYVDPENMVLFEPAHQFWPNIMHTWRKNYPDTNPLACHNGLLSDKTTSDFVLDKHLFPAEAEGDLIDRLSYRYIHEHGERMPQMTIDDYIKLSGIKPNALTMDVEGGELLILRGAENTLTHNNLKVWVSIHPELSVKNYDVTSEQLHSYLESLGYKGKYLATDHEEHWYFTKSKGVK